MTRFQIHPSLPQIYYIPFPQGIWWQIRGVAIYLFSSQPCTGLTTLIIVYITILGYSKYSFMYNTSHITSSRLSNKPGYMILIGTPPQHHTTFFTQLGMLWVQAQPNMWIHTHTTSSNIICHQSLTHSPIYTHHCLNSICLHEVLIYFKSSGTLMEFCQ